ncbi:MAG: phosphate transport system ATP-binding protein [Chloroflexota bacterium]|nr:phosphate transport system ATP-binding protein [Chloroflexota bacterium]
MNAVNHLATSTLPGDAAPTPNSPNQRLEGPVAMPTATSSSVVPESDDGSAGMEIRKLSAWYGPRQALRDITLDVPGHQVMAIIGPSGCGKSTLIRCLNRMHEVTHGATVRGEVILDGRNMYDPSVDPVALRRIVGMVFQRPNPFPTMSIYDNVVAGLRLGGKVGRGSMDEIVERSLRRAALWDEVRDKLKEGGASLSGGQQQRLCIARALAVEPEALLMDEPCSALDPIATLRIEELIRMLRDEVTIVIVTHNMQQAARVSDRTAFMLAGEERIGELIEVGVTKEIFTNPHDERTEDYITGRFG